MISFPLAVTCASLSPLPLTCFYSHFLSTLWTKFVLVTSVMLRSEIGSLPLFFPYLLFNLPFPVFSSKMLCCSCLCFAGILDYSWHSHSLASWSRSGYNPHQKQVANQQTSNLLAHNRSDSVTIGSPLPSLKLGQKVVVGGGSWRKRIVNHIAKKSQTPQPQNGSFGTEQSQIPSQQAATRQTSKAQCCSTLVMCFFR